MKENQFTKTKRNTAHRWVSAVFLLVLTFCAVAGFGSLAEILRQPSNHGLTEIRDMASDSNASASDATSADAVVNNLPTAKTAKESGHWEETAAGWIYLDKYNSMVRGDWVLDNGKYYYVNAEGIMESGEFRRVGDYWYHLAEDGALDTNRFFVGADEYFSDLNGVLYMNTWVPVGSDWYFCGDMGLIYKDTITPDGYHVDADGKMAASPGSRYEGFLYNNEGDHELYLNLGTADIIWKYLKKKGWTQTAIAGLLGNFQQESGISPTLEEAGNHIGYGLGQWSYDRRTALEAYAAAAGKNVGDIYMQLDFLCSESGEKSFVNSFARTEWPNAAQAAIEWGTRWERYNLSDLSMSRVRIPYAEAYFAHYVHGVKFLVSSTHYTEPLAPASPSDALPDASVPLSGATDPNAAAGTDGSSDAETTASESLPSHAITKAGTGSATKVKRVTETTASNGPGLASSSDAR